jgi:hypothetical protein
MTEINVQETIEKISKKSGEEVSKLQGEYEEILLTIAPGKLQTYKALRELNKKYAVGQSPAVSQEIVILSIGNEIDFTKKRVTNQIQAYNDDAESALEQGLVKMEGDEAVALDAREKFSNGNKNDNFGKPLLPSYNRHCEVLVKTEDGTFIHRGLELKNAHSTGELPPRNTLLKVRLLGNLDDKPLHTSDKASVFEVVEEITNDRLNEIVFEACGDEIKQLGDCMEYHEGLTEGTPEFYNRYVITMGTVDYVKRGEGDQKDGRPKKHFLVLNDPTVEKSIACNMEQAMELPDVETDVTVVAQTKIEKGWDKKLNDDKGGNTEEDVLKLEIVGIIPA